MQIDQMKSNLEGVHGDLGACVARSDPIDPYHSKPLDVHRWSDHPEIKGLLASIWNEFTAEELAILTPKGNRKPRGSAYDQLRVLLVDLYVAWLDDPTLCIGISRNNNSYTPNSRYNAIGISKRLIDVVDALVAHGYLDDHPFSHDRTYGGRNSRTTRYRSTSKLRAAFGKLSVSLFDIDHHKNEETVILSDFETDENGDFIKAKGKKKRKFIEYDDADAPEAARMRDDLKCYNELLRYTHIDIASLEQSYVERKRQDGTTQRLPITRANQWVRRIFSRGDWTCNGRFYGGWWQQVGSEYRKDIMLNGEPTIEVDFKGYHVSILAADQGVRKPDNYDWYDLGQVLLPAMDRTTQRQVLKLLVLTAINAKDQKTAFKAYRDAVRKSQSEAKPEGISRKALPSLLDHQLQSLMDQFLSIHPYLKEGVCSDRGISLMFLDSQVTAEVINSFVARNEPILSVHDSYIVRASQVTMLQESMKKATNKVIREVLPADQSSFSQSQLQGMLNDFRQHDYQSYSDYALSGLLNREYQPKQTKRYVTSLQKFKRWKEARAD